MESVDGRVRGIAKVACLAATAKQTHVGASRMLGNALVLAIISGIWSSGPPDWEMMTMLQLLTSQI